MFVPYASDQCNEYRPWMGYLLFPAIVIGAFALTVDEIYPELRSMLLLMYFQVVGFVLLLSMIISFFYVWTLGKAVCAKVGNIVYVVTLLLAIATGGLLALPGDVTIWLLSWTVYWLAGVFLVFCPLNSVDNFIFVPPFRTFSYTGVSAVIVWTLTDTFFCIALGWKAALLLHPLAMLLGIGWATLLLRVPFISRGLGDITLWQWIRGQAPQADLAWKDSWSEKKKQQQARDESKAERDRALQLHQQQMKTAAAQLSGETVAVLCQCGCVIHAPAEAEGHSVTCPECSRQVHIHKPDKRYS